MKIAYLDCATGIAGDMTLAALIDSGIDADVIRAGIDSLGLDGVELKTETVVKGGFRATYVKVVHPEQHAHRHLSDIEAILERADGVTDSQKTIAREIFMAVAGAEAKVHGSTIEKVHFHEVGAICWESIRSSAATFLPDTAKYGSITACALSRLPELPSCCVEFRWRMFPSKQS